MLGQIVVVCVFNLALISSELTGKIFEKRSDIDLQTCVANFEVHKDKIIRTQDSKNMGAKYINEIDLGSREECLRLCCETDNCDVFVYEEKNAGSCYLFQCGPPEDFKCKFTHHANYSSAILGVNRHVPDLESQIKLTKHEKDLAKLSFRKSEPEYDVSKNKSPEIKTTPSTTTITEAKVVPISPTKPILVENTGTTKCSRYQFECRSTKECIAIYNACDGIPQCADSSDEAPELECPEALTTPQPTRIRQNPVYEDANANLNRPIIPQYINQKYYPPAIPQREQANAPPPNLQRQEADFIRPDIRTGFIPRPPPPIYDSPNLPQYQQVPMQVQSNWLPRQPNQISQPYQQFEDRNSHIFNHKQNGLQVSEGQDLRYNKHKGALQVLHRALGYSSAGQTQYPENSPKDAPRIGSYLDEVYRQNSQYQEKWPKSVQDDRFTNQNPYTQEMTSNRVENWPQPNISPPVPEKTEKIKYPLQSSQEQLPGTWKSDKESRPHTDHEHEKMAHELKQSKNLMEKASDTRKIKIEKIKTHPHEHHDKPQYPEVAAYKVAKVLDLQDGITDTPGGAVLSLTLGLIITCVMALLIGCRLRVVRRRMRRGGKSYAHDADYLVNGMYL